MGLFGYSYVDLTEPQKQARREALDLHAFIAQISIVIVLKVFQLYYVGSWLFRRFGKGDEENRPSSPYLKAEMEDEKTGWKGRLRTWSAKGMWWMDDELPGGWGRKGEWVAGGMWLAWLLMLSFRSTGDDYMHFTKRFGIIGASQLPLHYLLAMKSSYSPLQLITKLSHEQLNVAHQILGHVIRIMLSSHACFYLLFFAQNNLLAKRIQDRDVILGLTCISIITITSLAAFSKVRKWNYRVFYTIHVFCATILLPLAYFHVHHIRPFIWESAAVYVLHIVLRIWDTKKHTGTLSLVPGTNLIQISISLHGSSRKFKPGQHIYFSFPAGNHTVPNVLLHNPFTVASLPKKDGQLVLVARALNGNTQRLASFARAADLQDPGVPRSIPVKIEGPYGISSHLPNFKKFDRILLVAGGVGATFIIPLWRDILDSKQNEEQLLTTDVRLVWAVRKLSETSWALPLSAVESNKNLSISHSETEIYVTSISGASLVSGSNDSIELAETDTLVDADDEKAFQEQGIAIKHRRPDLREIVDEAFSGHVGRVAVLVCGPTGMGTQLRGEVRKWVWRGKDVYYHAEAFGL